MRPPAVSSRIRSRSEFCAPPPPALAQSASLANADASDLDTVTVTGIRGSLQSLMNLKRDSVGVIDGIIAEDIGKFPDTNLARKPCLNYSSTRPSTPMSQPAESAQASISKPRVRWIIWD